MPRVAASRGCVAGHPVHVARRDGGERRGHPLEAAQERGRAEGGEGVAAGDGGQHEVVRRGHGCGLPVGAERGGCRRQGYRGGARPSVAGSWTTRGSAAPSCRVYHLVHDRGDPQVPRPGRPALDRHVRRPPLARLDADGGCRHAPSTRTAPTRSAPPTPSSSRAWPEPSGRSPTSRRAAPSPGSRPGPASGRSAPTCSDPPADGTTTIELASAWTGFLAPLVRLALGRKSPRLRHPRGRGARRHRRRARLSGARRRPPPRRPRRPGPASELLAQGGRVVRRARRRRHQPAHPRDRHRDEPPDAHLPLRFPRGPARSGGRGGGAGRARSARGARQPVTSTRSRPARPSGPGWPTGPRCSPRSSSSCRRTPCAVRRTPQGCASGCAPAGPRRCATPSSPSACRPTAPAPWRCSRWPWPAGCSSRWP